MSNIFGKMNERGFSYYEFTDADGIKCSLQESSLATEPAVWLGDDDDRMHLTVPMVERLLDALEDWHGMNLGLYYTFKDRNNIKSKVDASDYTAMLIGTETHQIKLYYEQVMAISDKLIYWLAEVASCDEDDD